MIETTSIPAQPTPAQRRNAMVMVASATVIQTIAQLLIKRGSSQLAENASVIDAALAMFTVLPIFCGYVLYGLFTVIMVFALKHGELSMLYPVMALSYIWVLGVSVVWFQEPVSVLQLAGVAVIVGGISVLGRGDKP